MSEKYIYKILLEAEYEEAKAAGVLLGAPIDLADGFIHFSLGDQVQETADKYFVNRGPAVLLAVLADSLPKSDLLFEKSRDGALFPHLYAPLPMTKVAATSFHDMDDQGHLDFTAAVKALEL